jgi:sec-independent protein translocase protein TatC
MPIWLPTMTNNLQTPGKIVSVDDKEVTIPSMAILDHLDELRKRLTWVAVGIFVSTVIGFFFAQTVLDFFLRPYRGQLQTIGPTEGLETYFKVAFIIGFVLSMPFTLYQFWLFISPGLTKKEKQYVYIFIPSAFGLFLLGLSFAWFVVAPAAVFFLADFMPDIFRADWTAQAYVSFILTMLFWLGLSFEMPIVIYFVARLGLVEPKTLREHWRYAVVGISILAAAITPSADPVTMILTMFPLLVLYGFSIGLAVIGKRQFERSMAVELSNE